MSRDVYPGLGHHSNCIGIKAVRLDARRIRFDAVALELVRPALGHLASAGIAGAKEQDFEFRCGHWENP
jgi:hypothetical protein